MPYYHVYIKQVKKGRPNQSLSIISFNRSADFVREKYASHYMKGRPFHFGGCTVKSSEITSILVFRSSVPFDQLILPNGKTPLDEPINEDYTARAFAQTKVNNVGDVTEEFITSAPEIEEETAKTSTESFAKKDTVFIVHGRDETQALRLQKHLRARNVDAEMFEDFKERSGSNTIIELLEYIWKKTGYAFIVTTADDLGVLRDEFEKSKNDMFRGIKEIEVAKVCSLLESLKTRARQNVVFEFGLFMGALGRDNVCCLLQEGTQERPSDIDGILYTSFTKSIDEKFGEIDAKLKKVGLVKA
jgi:predicted nucleotide-binding protein